MPYRLLLDNEPLIVVEVKGDLSDQELRAMTADATTAMRMHLSHGMRTAVVLDFSESGPIAPQQRKMIGEWRGEIRELTAQVCVGMAMVVKSPLIRGVLTAISWFNQEPIQVIFVDSFEAGVIWATARCDEAGIAVPARIIQRLTTRNDGPLRDVKQWLKPRENRR